MIRLSFKLFWIGALALSSCKDDSSNRSTIKNDTLGVDEAIAAAESLRGKDPDASGGNTCLLAYQQKYDQLIAESEVSAATGFSPGVMETKYNKVMKPEYHSFQYTFKNGRKGKVLGFDREMELSDVVSVGSIKAMSLQQFKDSYRVVTDEEMQAVQEALNDLSDGGSGNDQADAALKKAKDQNLDKKTIRKAGGGILSTIKEVSKANTPVAGVGDAAVWNPVTDDLHVLQDGVKFDLKASISNDKEVNKALAIKLAQKVLEHCK